MAGRASRAARRRHQVRDLVRWRWRESALRAGEGAMGKRGGGVQKLLKGGKGCGRGRKTEAVALQMQNAKT